MLLLLHQPSSERADPSGSANVPQPLSYYAARWLLSGCPSILAHHSRNAAQLRLNAQIRTDVDVSPKLWYKGYTYVWYNSSGASKGFLMHPF